MHKEMIKAIADLTTSQAALNVNRGIKKMKRFLLIIEESMKQIDIDTQLSSILCLPLRLITHFYPLLL